MSLPPNKLEKSDIGQGFGQSVAAQRQIEMIKLTAGIVQALSVANATHWVRTKNIRRVVFLYIRHSFNNSMLWNRKLTF